MAVTGYRELVANALTGDGMSWEDVERVLLELGGGMHGQVPDAAETIDATLDCFHALRECDAGEAVHPWNQGKPLSDRGLHVEAAQCFLRAAELLTHDPGRSEDDELWAAASLAHAVSALLAADRPLTAAVAAARIDDPEYAAEARAAIQGWLER